MSQLAIIFSIETQFNLFYTSLTNTGFYFISFTVLARLCAIHATIFSFLKVFNRLGRVWMDATKTARWDVAIIWSGKQKEKQLN